MPDGPRAVTDAPLVLAERAGLQFAGPVQALEAIDLRIRAGEFISLVGPSGCGKSTLLRLVAGLLTPTQGTVSVAGMPPARARRTSTKVSLVFQDATLLPWRTVETNVGLPLELAGVGREARRGPIRQGLARVGLADFATRFPRELSGGMRMRAALARALVTEPDLLLLDEPFGALDDMSRQALNEELNLLWRKDRVTSLFVTHNISEAVFLGTRVLVMSERPGRLVADVHVPFAADRTAALRSEPEFGRLVGEVSRHLRGSREARCAP